MIERNRGLGQGVDDIENPFKRMNKRGDIGELTADMCVDTAYANAGQRSCRLIDTQGFVIGNAEFVIF